MLERPILRWHGGKWRLAPWIVSTFPMHRTYVEPFGGAGSVLLRKPRSYAEVWNDLDGEVVNLFRVLRSAEAGRLVDMVQMTPFAREEFALAYEPHDEPVERARRLLVRAAMGFGSGLATARRSTGFRADSKRAGTTPAHDWQNYPPVLAAAIDRMRGVVIESRPALELLATHDGPGTLFYVDPPYLHSTRSKKRGMATLHHRYAVELTDADHADLLAALRRLRGQVVLSGYPHPLYDDTLTGWRRIERAARADGAKARTEVLWLNFRDQGPLFNQKGLI